jgi:hypothetical protein
VNTVDTPVAFVVVQAVMALVLISIGSWGRREAHTLPPAHLDAAERQHRSQVLGRGAVACLVVGWVLALTVVWFGTAKLL